MKKGKEKKSAREKYCFSLKVPNPGPNSTEVLRNLVQLH